MGGDLGFFTKGLLPPAFDEAMFRLAPGSTSEVVSTEYGYHLFRVLEKKPARKRELVEVRASIEQRLLSRLRTEAQRQYTEGLKAKADVKVNGDSLQAATGRPLVAPSLEP